MRRLGRALAVLYIAAMVACLVVALAAWVFSEPTPAPEPATPAKVTRTVAYCTAATAPLGCVKQP